MKVRYVYVFIMALALVFAACSTKDERLIKGKWTLAGRMVGGTPTSFWFKGETVIAPWEKRKIVMKSSGKYEFLDNRRIKIMMKSGFYKGNVYFFDIIKLDEESLIFRTNYQEIKFKKVS